MVLSFCSKAAGRVMTIICVSCSKEMLQEAPPPNTHTHIHIQMKCYYTQGHPLSSFYKSGPTMWHFPAPPV